VWSRPSRWSADTAQIWILRAAPDDAEAAAALNTALYNLAVAVGAWLGGLVVDTTPVGGVLITGTVFAAAAIVAITSGGRR
jgi:predicted MFS family arabinose efflux permease